MIFGSDRKKRRNYAIHRETVILLLTHSLLTFDKNLTISFQSIIKKCLTNFYNEKNES